MRVLLLLSAVLLLTVAPAAAAQHPASDPAPAEAAADDRQEGEADGLGWAIEGYLSFEARLRFAGDETDLDLYTHIFADAVREKGDIPLRVRLNGRLFADAGGNQQPGDRLYDMWGTFDSDVQFRLYEGYIEATIKAIDIRVGRQFIEEGTYLHFDGARATKEIERFSFTVVFGVPVRFGEPSRAGNLLAGVIIHGKIDERTRARFEYYHVEERIAGINDPVVDPLQQPISIPNGTLEDDLFGLSVWHHFNEQLRFFGRFSLLEGEANELHLRLRWFTLDGAWTIVLEWYQMFERLLAVTNDLTPFVPMLGSYEPFARATVRVTHRMGEEWIVVGSFSYRGLHDDANEGLFNHEYFQAYVSATRTWERWDATITATGYETSGTGNDIFALGGSASYQVSAKVFVSGGIDYSLYKYIWFQNTEREDVWSYWLRVRWDYKEKIRVTGGVTVDDDRFDVYTTFFVRVTVRF